MARDTAQASKSPNTKGVVAEALKFQTSVEEFEATLRADQREDARFAWVPGNQWQTKELHLRHQSHRPTLEINKLPQFLRQITNEVKQNRPAMKVIPSDDFADVETADKLTSLVRYIETRAKGDMAYDEALHWATTVGVGYFRVLTDYTSYGSLNQDICIRPIFDPHSVYFDPDSREVDGCDAQRVLITEDMPRESFERLYPKADTLGIPVTDATGWITRDTIRVGEFFRVEYEQAPKGLMGKAEAMPRVHWYKLTATEILDHRILPISYIPVFPVYGELRYIEGRKECFGMVRMAKDPQRMYNYWTTIEAELLQLAPKAPWIGAQGQFEGHPEWNEANIRNFAKLEYVPVVDPVTNTVLPPPQRTDFAQVPVGVVTAKQGSDQDLKAVMGIYDPSLGQASNEVSGRAILARQHSSNVANFHYVDNLGKAIRHAGCVILQWLPHIYDTARTLRILGEDGTIQQWAVNQADPVTGRLWRLDMGEYDIIATTGPSFATRRQEGAETQLEFLRLNPGSAPLISDLVVKAQDWPGAQQMAQRLKAMLPPEIRQAEDQGQSPEVGAALAQAGQLEQQLQQVGGELQQTQIALKSKELDVQVKQRELDLKNLELQLKAREAEVTLETEKVKAQAMVESAAATPPAQMNFPNAGPEVFMDLVQSLQQTNATLGMLAEGQMQTQQTLQALIQLTNMVAQGKSKVGQAKRAPDGTWSFNVQESPLTLQ